MQKIKLSKWSHSLSAHLLFLPENSLCGLAPPPIAAAVPLKFLPRPSISFSSLDNYASAFNLSPPPIYEVKLLILF